MAFVITGSLNSSLHFDRFLLLVMIVDFFSYTAGSSHNGKACDIRPWNLTNGKTKFSVPADTQPGNLFIFCFVAETDTHPSITGYAQIAVHVIEQ